MGKVATSSARDAAGAEVGAKLRESKLKSNLERDLAFLPLLSGQRPPAHAVVVLVVAAFRLSHHTIHHPSVSKGKLNAACVGETAGNTVSRKHGD